MGRHVSLADRHNDELEHARQTAARSERAARESDERLRLILESATDFAIITLDVERWYTGGEGDTVQITAPDGLEALIGGIDFVDGETYLVIATDGTVNYCGYSGPATPDLQSVYDAAFPG